MTRRELTALLGLPLAARTPLRPLRIGVTQYPSAAPFYLALERGYFREAGLDMQVEAAINSLGFMQAMLSGEMAISMAPSMPALFNAAAKGGALRIVCARETAATACEGHGVIYAREKSFSKGLASFAELAGKRVAHAARGTVSEFALDVVLGSVGLSQKNLQVAVLSASEAAAALVGGQIDAFISSGDTGLGVDSLGSGVFWRPGLGKIVPGCQVSFHWFTRPLLEGSTETGIRFLRAYLRGVAAFRAGQTPRFLDDWARSNKFDPIRVRRSCRDTVSADGVVSIPHLQRFLDWAHAKKYSERRVRAQEVVDSRFLKGLAR
jgi:NitT/TauT family transport system substrate-binding protein